MTNVKIAAVVVTYNRLHLLKETVDRIRDQSRIPDGIIVVNNASSDGTGEWLAEQADITVVTQDNAGSAGGQYTGIKTGHDRGFDWLWCMDDDCMPESRALEELERFLEDKNTDTIGFLASKVLWTDSTPHLMNLPGYFYNKRKWNFIGYEKFDKGSHAIDVCSFVSCLINAKAISRVGLPDPKFFIWYDDLDYTMRFRRYENYYVAASIVIHKTQSNASPGLSTVGGEFDDKKYYGLRNFYFIYRRWNIPYLLAFSIELGYRIARSMVKRRITFKTTALYAAAVFDGLLGRMDKRPFCQ